MTKKEFTRSTIPQVIGGVLETIKQAKFYSTIHKTNKTRVICTLYDKDGSPVKMYHGRRWVKELRNDMYQMNKGYIEYGKFLGYTR